MYQTFSVPILFFAILLRALATHASPLAIRCSNVTTKWQSSVLFEVSSPAKTCENIFPAFRTQYAYAEESWRAEWHFIAQELLRLPEPPGSTSLISLSGVACATARPSKDNNFTGLSSFYTSSLRDLEMRASLAQCSGKLAVQTCKLLGAREGLVACIEALWLLAANLGAGEVAILLF